VLWRESYTPAIRSGTVLPSVSLPEATQCVAGAFAASDFRDLEVWRRLFETASFQYALLAPAALEEMFPPTIQRRFVTMTDSTAWLEAIGNARAFAYIVGAETCPQLVIGPPTEEVWEGFETLVRELGSP